VTHLGRGYIPKLSENTVRETILTLEIIHFASIQNKSLWYPVTPLNERFFMQLIMQVIIFSGVNKNIIHDHSRPSHIALPNKTCLAKF